MQSIRRHAPTRALCLALLAFLPLASACRTNGPPLEVVEAVDLERYQGRWYEIASFPQRFQQGCVATRATYSLATDGTVSVLNECRNDSLSGDWRRVEGKAWVTDPAESTAKLEVQFFWPFSGAYWVIELDPEYRYAVVGHPSRTYLWILSRTPQMDDVTYQSLLARIEAKGYDLSPLERTLQAPAGSEAAGSAAKPEGDPRGGV